MGNDKILEIALFRFSLISSLIHLKDERSRNQMINNLIKQEYDIPYSKKRKVSRKTLLRYLKAYKENGFDGLKLKERNDKNKTRSISDDVLSEIIKLRKEEPQRSTNQIIQIMKLNPKYKDIILAERTISRIFKNLGLRRKDFTPKKIRYAFEMEHINELWETDIMEGIFIPKINKKTFLFAFIDDYSRIIPHAQFYLDEKLPRLEDCFKKAILKRGIPKKLYTDNGKVFVSQHLKRICAELGIKLIHHLPYSPQSKGKQERFFKTVDIKFMKEIKGANITSLEQLNSFFYAWLEVSYHRIVHKSIGITPIERFTQDLKETKIREVESMEEITEIFLYRENRKVHKTQGLISLFQNHYQIDEVNLLGKDIEVRYNAFDLSKVYIYYENSLFKYLIPVT